MRQGLFVATVVGAAAGAVATGTLLSRLMQDVDGTLATLACAWASSPYLLAMLLAYLRRARTTQLAAVLVALALSASAGLSLFTSALAQKERADREVATAVMPGEDPDRGPAAMRRAGAEAGQFVGGAVSAALVALVPLAQLLAIALASLAGVVASAVLGRSRAEGITRHDPTRGETWQAAVL